MEQVPASLNSFDELFAVSDLHLGGESGFQAFRQGEALAGAIRAIAEREVNRIALVLNGDIVDFLAEKPHAYLDPDGAPRKLRRVANDPAFKEVFAALSEFVQLPGRRLVLVLGNHDVELAFPDVQREFLSCIGACNAARAGRVVFATDGSGWTCGIRGKHVLCLHGNEFDAWNVIDFQQLLQTKRALLRRKDVRPWKPNAGTKLVIDVINDVKRRFPFVDLLKPETRPLPAILAAMDPSALLTLQKLGPALARLVSTEALQRAGFLGAPSVGGSGDKEERSRWIHAPRIPPLAERQRWVESSLRAIEHRRAAKEDVVETALANEEGFLGLTAILWDALSTGQPQESLRLSLQSWLAADRSFDLLAPDSTFSAADDAVAPEVDVLITGHTHLARSLQRRGGGAYLNCGTWMRLIQIPKEALDSLERFRRMYEVLRAGNVEALDGEENLVLNRTTLAHVFSGTERGVTGELMEACRVENSQWSLNPIEGTQRVVA